MQACCAHRRPGHPIHMLKPSQIGLLCRTQTQQQHRRNVDCTSHAAGTMQPYAPQKARTVQRVLLHDMGDACLPQNRRPCPHDVSDGCRTENVLRNCHINVAASLQLQALCLNNLAHRASAPVRGHLESCTEDAWIVDAAMEPVPLQPTPEAAVSPGALE